MSWEFAIPVQKDELLEAHAGQYTVEDVIQPRILLSKLQDAARAYNSEGAAYILEHFDTYFSILVHGVKLEWNILNKGFDHMERAVKNLCNSLELVFQEQEIGEEARVKHLNIVKMIMYLYVNIMKTKDAKLAADNSTKLTLGKKSKKAVDADGEASEWTEGEKLAALITLHHALQLPLSRLWDPPLAEDNFVSMVAEPCYKAVEEQIIKNKPARETTFQILGILTKKYNHGTSCLIKLVQILQISEFTVSPICAGVVQLTKEFGLGTFGPQMVREIAEALASSEEGEGASTEHSAAKNCGTFLLELTKELPEEMSAAITTLQPYLETDESYTLRISVLGMMSEVLCTTLRGEGLSEAQRTRRDDFLEDLEEHMHDLSAHVRSKVLQYWCRLQRENSVPVARQRTVLERATGRLRDKAALVRKAAVQLLKIFIEFNPFSAQLTLEVLEEQLEKEKKILEDLQKKLNPGPDENLVKKWESIKNDVINMINEKIDTLTQDEPELTQASIDNVYGSIRKHLMEKHYFKAYLVVKHAERMYPDAKLLRCDMDKTDQVAYFVSLLRNVFIIPDRCQTISLTQQCENELALWKRVEEKESIVAFLEESTHFSRMMTEAVPLINALLMSKQAGDVGEAIEFFTVAHQFNIESAKIGVASMLLLVWSPDQDKREAVERAYREMYLDTNVKPERARAFTVARNLVGLVSHINRGNALALEHLVDKWVERGELSTAIIQVFWELFLKKIDGTTDGDSRAALALLVMVAKARPSVTLANLEVIQSHGLTGDYQTRVMSAQLLLALAKKNHRYPADHLVFTSLMDSLLECYSMLNKFASLAATAVDAIYAICDTPEVLAAKLIHETWKRLDEKTDKIEGEEDVRYPLELLTRFIFFLGHVALQQLIHLDVSVYSELRRRNQVKIKVICSIAKKKGVRFTYDSGNKRSASSRDHTTYRVREDRKLEEKRKKKAGAFATPGRARKSQADNLRRQTLMNVSNASASSRQQRSGSVLSSKGTTGNSTMTEEEGGMEGAVADDADAEYVRSVCELHIVGEGTALGRYLPLLRHALSSPASFPQPALQAAAAITLTRFMLVSSSVCEDSLQLVLTVLQRSQHSGLRTNLTVAFADLTLRFPNLTQPWTKHIYHILSDGSLDVRQCAVKMLSFLVLHEMVRVKGQIADMALCCVDPDTTVASMTRLFFKQLSQKGNSLYNVMPDIISRLSDPSLAVMEDHFRTIMKYITSLIQKDRQMEALVEKLCQRFKLATEERQCRDLAYCLSLFTYNERSLRKLIENVDCYRDKLHARGVRESFQTLMNSANKNAKNDIKALVVELGDKIEECFAVREGEDEDEGAEGEVRAPATPRTAPPRRARATPRRQRRRRSSTPDENEPPNTENTPTSVRKSSRQARAQPKRFQEEDSDESDEDEDFQKKDEEVFKKPVARTTGRKRK